MPKKRKSARISNQPRRRGKTPVRPTSREPFATELPSDLEFTLRLPPEARRDSTVRADPAMPTTVIPELAAVEFTPFAFQCVLEAIRAADDVQRTKLNPEGGPNLRYRVELAAAFLASAMEAARTGAEETGAIDPEVFVNLATHLVVRRAEEIFGQGGA